MDKNEIIEKVQKLLALATSPNENEAKLAAAKAHELLTKYNLSLEQVEESRLGEEYGALDKDQERTAKPIEDRYILSILQQYFYVKVVTCVRTQKLPWGTNRKAGYKFTLIGRKHNVQIARYVYDFLFRSFRSTFIEFCKQNGFRASGAAARVRKGYYRGLYYGLAEQLEANRQKALAAEKALVVAEDKNIDKFMEQHFGEKVKDGKPSREGQVNQAAVVAGYQEGKNMKIAMGITGSTDQQPQIGQVLRLEDKS